MAITKQKKTETLAKLAAGLKDASSIAFVAFKGLKANDAAALRRTLKTSGVSYMVSKKTLLKRVLNDLGIAGDMPELPGEIAIAYSKDQIAPTREIYTFGKKLGGSLALAGGVFESKYITAHEANAIATIPGREVLLGQFVGLLTSPMRGLAIALSEVAKQRA